MSKEDRVTWPSSRQNLPCRKPSARSEPVTLVTQDKPSWSLSPQTSGAQQWCDCQRKRHPLARMPAEVTLPGHLGQW